MASAAATFADIELDGRGAVWAATEGGLSVIKQGRVTTLTSKNGLPCDAVYWRREADDHSNWLYMSCGLVRIAPNELAAWMANPKYTPRTTLFDGSDGVRLHAIPISGYYTPHAAKSADGKLWFVAGAGVSVIDPAHLPVNKLPPPVHIEQIIADDKPYEIKPGMRLPANPHDVTIDYTALSLAAPEKVHFKYKLEGQDRDWREVVNDREVQYSNLRPRQYRFRVMACNNSGVWNETGDTLEFSIAPAYYQTTWFYASCVAAFLAMLWGLYRLRLYQIRREFNAQLDGRVDERMRVARELHDTLLQSFQASRDPDAGRAQHVCPAPGKGRAKPRQSDYHGRGGRRRGAQRDPGLARPSGRRRRSRATAHGGRPGAGALRGGAGESAGLRA